MRVDPTKIRFGLKKIFFRHLRFRFFITIFCFLWVTFLIKAYVPENSSLTQQLIFITLMVFFSFASMWYLIMSLINKKIIDPLNDFVDRIQLYKDTNHFEASTSLLPRELVKIESAFIELTKNIQDKVFRAEQESKKLNNQSLAKTRAIVMFSNELRTPINEINGLCELLEDSNLSYDQKQIVNELKRSTHFLQNSFHDFLDLTHCEMHMIKFDYSEFSVTNLIDSVLLRFQKDLIRKNIKLKCDIEKDYIVKSDRIRLEHILNNFVSNALKISSVDSRLDIRCFREFDVEAENRLYFEIRDYGVGMSTDFLNMISDNLKEDSAFYEKKGLGLGFIIANKIIEGLGGRLKVSSEFNQGTCISFFIETEFLIKKENLAEVLPIRQPEILNNKKVLVVDDNQVNLKVLTGVLGKLGSKNFTATNGLEAVAICMIDDIDYIFMDYQMPVMDGLLASIEIMKNAKKQNLKIPQIVMLSAHVTDEFKGQCQKVGLKHFLEKPLQKEKIYNILKAG